MTQAHTEQGGMQRIVLSRNELTVECFFSDRGKLERKIEHLAGKPTEYLYRFDNRGRLLKVFRDEALVEEYRYNRAGQRIEQRREDLVFLRHPGSAGENPEAPAKRRLFWNKRVFLRQGHAVGRGFPAFRRAYPLRILQKTPDCPFKAFPERPADNGIYMAQRFAAIRPDQQRDQKARDTPPPCSINGCPPPAAKTSQNLAACASPPGLDVVCPTSWRIY